MKQVKHNNQQGFVSIIVCIIIMVILSLITIGFAQIMGREQRQALDRQLSSQAFYAAESGVNDARVAMSSYSATCSGAGQIVDTTVNITCVTTNEKPKSIKEDNLYIDPKVFPIHVTDPSTNTPVAPDSIIVKWRKASTGGTDFRAPATTFPTASAWGVETGLIKVYLIPFRNNDSRASLVSKQAMVLLNPTSSSPTSPNPTIASIQGAGQGAIVNGTCTAGECSATIDTTSLNLGSNYDELYMVVSSFYKPSNLDISAELTSGTSLEFHDVQAVVDATGRTNDVLRRIQVRVPLRKDYQFSGAALRTFGSGPTDGVCKLWSASPVSSSNGC